jgi:hypothetical protein
LAEEKMPSPRWSPLPLLWVFLLNAVPVYGILFAGWSWATALSLYFCEYLLQVLFVASRMVIHRRLTRKGGYRQGDVGIRVAVNGKARHFKSKSFLVEFLMVSLGSTLTLALFLTLFLYLVLGGAPGTLIQWPDLWKGVAATALLLLGDFVIDLQDIRDRPFAWIRALNQSAMDRMGVIIFTFFFGFVAFAVSDNPAAFFLTFMAIKLLFEIVRALPPGKISAAAQAWTLKNAGKFKKELEQERRQELKEEKRQAEKDEQVIPFGR